MKFWNWIENEATGFPELSIYRRIELGKPCKQAKEDFEHAFEFNLYLNAYHKNNNGLTVWIDSCGGDSKTALFIYDLLMEYKSGGKNKITVKIDNEADSAASVIAMTGDTVLMSPTASMTIHYAFTTITDGRIWRFQKAIRLLRELNEKLITIYQNKTGLSRKKIARLLEYETILDAKKAIELGFADGILNADEHIPPRH